MNLSNDYYFSFGSLHGPRMEKYRPQPTSLSAKYLKVCEILNGAPRNFFYDSSSISNLGPNKSKYLERRGTKLHLTEKGRHYLKTHDVEVDINEWLETNSWMRFTCDEVDRVAAACLIGSKKYNELAKLYNNVIRKARNRFKSLP